jgi:ABC-type enterochelin transport system ATPase subunit
LTPNPILKVLSTLKTYEVKCLLIGGQACILYGAVEFSRDSDFIMLADPQNIDRLKNALKALNMY